LQSVKGQRRLSTGCRMHPPPLNQQHHPVPVRCDCLLLARACALCCARRFRYLPRPPAVPPRSSRPPPNTHAIMGRVGTAFLALPWLLVLCLAGIIVATAYSSRSTKLANDSVEAALDDLKADTGIAGGVKDVLTGLVAASWLTALVALIGACLALLARQRCLCSTTQQLRCLGAWVAPGVAAQDARTCTSHLSQQPGTVLSQPRSFGGSSCRHDQLTCAHTLPLALHTGFRDQPQRFRMLCVPRPSPPALPQLSW